MFAVISTLPQRRVGEPLSIATSIVGNLLDAFFLKVSIVWDRVLRLEYDEFLRQVLQGRRRTLSSVHASQKEG